MLNNKELGIYLKNIRENKKMSLRQVDYQSSVSFSHLSMIENGSRKPTALTLKELAKVYDVDYIDLYEKAGYLDLAESEKISKKENNDSNEILKLSKIGFNKDNYNPPTETQKEQIRGLLEVILKDNKKKEDK